MNLVLKIKTNLEQIHQKQQNRMFITSYTSTVIKDQITMNKMVLFSTGAYLPSSSINSCTEKNHVLYACAFVCVCVCVVSVFCTCVIGNT